MTFTGPIQVYPISLSLESGFEDLSADDILDNLSASFATYDLTTSIGPIVGSSDDRPWFFLCDDRWRPCADQRRGRHLYCRDNGNSRALQLGDDADWLRRPRVRGISQGKGGPRNSRHLVACLHSARSARGASTGRLNIGALLARLRASETSVVGGESLWLACQALSAPNDLGTALDFRGQQSDAHGRDRSCLAEIVSPQSPVCRDLPSLSPRSTRTACRGQLAASAALPASSSRQNYVGPVGRRCAVLARMKPSIASGSLLVLAAATDDSSAGLDLIRAQRQIVDFGSSPMVEWPR